MIPATSAKINGKQSEIIAIELVMVIEVDNQPTVLKNSQNTPKMPVITIENTNGITTHTPVTKNVTAALVMALVKRLLDMCLLSIFLAPRSILLCYN